MSADWQTLAEYTDSDELTHEQAKVRIRNTLVGRDYEERLSAAALAERCPGVSASTVRDLVADVRREYNVAVYSRGSGYWHLQTPAELDDALGRIDAQIETKRETKRELAAAFNRGRSE
jgi:hypothetical protein